MNTVGGVADIDFVFAAWFVDPHRNSIGLLQLKDTDCRDRSHLRQGAPGLRRLPWRSCRRCITVSATGQQQDRGDRDGGGHRPVLPHHHSRDQDGQRRVN